MPEEIFGKISQSLSDIRIFGIKANKDTIEVPNLLWLTPEKTSTEEVIFRTGNTSHNDKGYYFTFEIPAIEPINQIRLEFKQENFDWRLKLEGSQNQKEWFTVIENYRILSIKNEITDFQFTKLTFPSSKYRFFQLPINSQGNLDLEVASIAQTVITNGIFRNYFIKKTEIKENRQPKQTEIDIELQLPVPVSHIKLSVKDTFDYYRPITIKYFRDSIATAQGWKYNYSTLASGVLNSIEGSEFKFNSTTLQKLKILIYNQDNQD